MEASREPPLVLGVSVCVRVVLPLGMVLRLGVVLKVSGEIDGSHRAGQPVSQRYKQIFMGQEKLIESEITFASCRQGILGGACYIGLGLR
jgi:hypothetical protein